ncbi:hypothetical protein CfE428DRAFT_5516 [Chthoniobacter flavus Ellin428]|uniref:Uncharacterized protein n=1 Tax=Chthoniobacter flavus Ellin428 TaxID=497964 RepID=B4D9C6_9BACT|nr:hypothetical protein [Chthoniobacter flavus]EDY16887.1 hypothetical protein CfE428DRAFT_5516 [Chthoniobacter flavus Ellin428]TCO87769.1 hypothetical protein EV701_12068 [Chthoniobacter flavus]
MRPFILFVQVLALILSGAGMGLAQEPFHYDKRSVVRQKDTVFENQLYFDLYAQSQPADGTFMWGLILRGPGRIFGARGKLRAFTQAELKLEILPSDLEDEFRCALDALDLGRLPQSPDLTKEKQYPTVQIEYGEIHRYVVLSPDADLARKLDALVEDFVQKMAQEPRQSWHPEQRAFEGDDQPAQPVTFQELLADPFRFHGKRVRVTGYYSKGVYTKDDGVLMSDREPESQGQEEKPGKERRGAFWVTAASCFLNKKHSDSKAMDGDRMVTIEGTFHAGFRGSLGEFNGIIKRATRFTLAQDPPSKSR